MTAINALTAAWRPATPMDRRVVGGALSSLILAAALISIGLLGLHHQVQLGGSLIGTSVALFATLGLDQFLARTWARATLYPTNTLAKG